MDSKPDRITMNRVFILFFTVFFLFLRPSFSDNLVILNNNQVVAEVLEGTIYHGKIIFSNTSDLAVKVANVRSTCGCTVVGNTEKTIPPHQTDSIEYHFNSANYRGHVNKRMIVMTETNSLIFNFTVIVESLVHVPDQLIDLGPVRKSMNPIHKDLPIIFHTSCTNPSISLMTPNPIIQKFELRKNKDGNHLMSLVFKPDDITGQSYQNLVFEVTCNEKKKQIHVNVVSKPDK